MTLRTFTGLTAAAGLWVLLAAALLTGAWALSAGAQTPGMELRCRDQSGEILRVTYVGNGQFTFRVDLSGDYAMGTCRWQ